jgi:ADP-heptose:LPS heptosyltransferase/SAM-dependent methyltransferase
MNNTAQPQFAIAIFHAAGDILNCTPIARQLRLDHPDAKITWITSERFAFLLDQNPHIDELIALPGDPKALPDRMEEFRQMRPWTRFFDPAPYRNYKLAPGGSLLEIIRASADLRWSAPPRSVMRLRPEEVEEARAYWATLPDGPKILLETDFLSDQSPWVDDCAFEVLDVLADLDPVLVFSARRCPPFLEALKARHAKTFWCELGFRPNAELYNLCDAFIGVSSGLSCLSLTDWCRRDVPSLELTRGDHWSLASSGVPLDRRYGYSRLRFREELENLKARLLGGALEPDFSPNIRALETLPDGRERIPCPACGCPGAHPVRGEDIVECESCHLIFLRDRPSADRLKTYYTSTYAIGDEGAAPAVRVPPSRAAADQDPGWRGAQRTALVDEALAFLGGRAEGRRIVDVGCGWGPLLHGARERGMIPTGFEFTEPNVRFGREVMELDIRQQSFPEGELDEASVDLVTFSHSLEHVPHPLVYLQKAAHILKADGILSIVVPNFLGLGSTGLGEAWPWLERDWHYLHFSPASLKSLVQECGFHVEACYTTSGDLGRKLPLELIRKACPGDPEDVLEQKLLLVERMGKGEEIHLVARKLGGYKGRVKPRKGALRPEEVSSILWIRTDAIGDALLSMAMLPRVAERFPGVPITVVCQEGQRPLYEACPHVAGVIGYLRAKAYEDEAYRGQIAAQIKAVGADLCLNSVYSREPIGDLWAAACGAARRVGHRGDGHNMSEEQHRVLDPVYTDLLPSGEEHALELDRHQAYLQSLGCEASPLSPRVWFTDEDRTAAEAILARHQLDPARTIALFAGAQFDMRVYGGYGEALAGLCAERGLRLVALGAARERELNQVHLDRIGNGAVNLCGELDLRICAALLARCRLAVGAETGLAHMACAVGTPHVVVLGGGHFGRFMPYSQLTSVAVLPLDCFLCDWACRHARPHCVKDLHPGVLEEAVRRTLDEESDRPRVFAQAGGESEPLPAQVIDLQPALDSALAKLIPVMPGRPRPAGEPASTVEAVPGPEARTTVICAVWHKDPKRLELLRGHQACLDRQTVPVERVYVFDGGDPAPAWVKGRVIASREPLGLYEAWNVALSAVRTPFVMNLNLDDRLNPEAVDLYQRVLDEGADLVGGDWRICFSQEETDAVTSIAASESLPFHPDWPPVPHRPVRLGSGTGDRGTLGPACAWRTALHGEVGRYPWRFADGSPIRIIGDSAWWRVLMAKQKVLKRLPILVGRYYSHPEEQAEFRNPSEGEEAKLKALGIGT